MTESMMNIPKTLRVGYQERSDTFTGKLAYVIYIDEKGKVRKEGSWKSWCDSKQGSNDYENVPTSGFVLNKKVGDYKSDWNHRKAHIRVYDPRGFEFEIGVENLLYILEECSSIKGKGLEGEFVYAWDGSDLVLLPVTSQEYISSRKFTDMKTMKVSKADMKEGCVYVTKDMREVMYLGHHEIFEFDNIYLDNYSRSSCQHKSVGKQHVFVYMKVEKPSYGEPEKYWFQSGFTKLASKVSDEVSSTYADEYTEFKESLFGCQCKEIEIVEMKISDKKLEERYYGMSSIIKKGNDYIMVDIRSDYGNRSNYFLTEKSKIIIGDSNVSTSALAVERKDTWGCRYQNYKEPTKLTKEQLKEVQLYSINFKNKHGKIISITN